MLREHFFADPSSMMAALQSALLLQLQQDLQHNAEISLFLSGGMSPAPLYRALSQVELPWQRIKIALVDERFVPVTHEASNEKLLRNTLLRDHAAAAVFTGMSVAASAEHSTLSAVAQRSNDNYMKLPRPYSAALLGIGPDGHTASLFPHAKGTDEAFAAHRHCVAIHAQPSPATGAVIERISMTPWALLQCRTLYLLFTGNEKKIVYERAKTADHSTLPIAFFLQQQKVPLEVFWCP